MKSLNKLRYICLVCFIFYSCDPDIEITNTYIYNSNWENNKANFLVYKLNVPEKFMSEKSKINGTAIATSISDKEIQIDSSFCYRLRPHNNSSEKIFFNKKNTGILFTKCGDITTAQNTIGKLENKSWYVFINVYDTWVYYVYIDSQGEVKKYVSNLNNW